MKLFRIQKESGFTCSLFSLFFIISISLFSQTKFYISGKIIEGKTDYLYLSRMNFWYFLPIKFDSIKINSNNTFSKNLIVPEEPFFIYYKSKNLGFIFPKSTSGTLDSIKLNVDLLKYEFFVDDDNKDLYKFFYNYEVTYRENGGFDSTYKSNLQLTSSEFVSILKKEYDRRDKEIEYTAKSFPRTLCFFEYLKKTNYYEFYTKLFDYMLNHNYFLNRSLDYFPQDDILSEEFRKMELDESDIRIPQFGYLLKYIVANAYDSIIYLNKDRKIEISSSSYKFEYAKKRYPINTELRDLSWVFVIKDLIDRATSPSHFYKADSLIQQLEKNSQSEIYLKFIRGYYTRKNNNINSEIDFTLKDINGGEFKLSSLKNKTVIIFFWGTWCPPCKKQIPFLNSTIEELKSQKEIVFLNVGLENNNFKKWKKVVISNKMSGINLYAEGNFACSELTKFNLTFAPRVVIMKDGKIINFNAPLPENNLSTEIKTY